MTMADAPTCRSCGTPIPEGQGRYSTPDGLFCVHCGLRSAIVPNLITVTDQDQDEQQEPCSIPGVRSEGSDQLHLACEFGDDDFARQLLDAGVKVNARNKDDGRTPLHMACLNGHEGNVRLMLENGADVNAADTWGATPLHYACAAGHPATIRLLLSRGAEVNARDDAGRTSLHFACWYGHPDIVRLLLVHGAEVSAKDEGERSPLHLACQRPEDNPGREEIIDLFREYAPELVFEAFCDAGWKSRPSNNNKRR